jgi:hypothetical protein
VPNFATKCCHNFALGKINIRTALQRAEFINKFGSREKQNFEEQYEEQYDEDSNGRQGKGNAFTAIFQTMGSARIKTQNEVNNK